MSHPFGDLLTYYASRKHGLSQNKLAETADLAPSVLSRMCHGERLSGPRARERVLRVLLGLLRHGALRRRQEADQLLEAAGMTALRPDELEALIEQLTTLPAEIALLHKLLAELRRRDDQEAPSLSTTAGAGHSSHLPAPLFPEQHLPAPDYHTLVGVGPTIQDLALRLSDPTGPPLLSIEGLGGIGKTALARAVALTCMQLRCFQTTLWVSARHARLADNGALIPEDPAITLQDVLEQLTEQVGLPLKTELPIEAQLARLYPLFRQTPYLVVLDNLETFAELEMLLPRLQPLAGATRFLLTSRHTLSAFPYVHIFKVRVLSAADSRLLVKNELARRDHGLEAPPEFVEALLATVGGLPLALKLATAQIGRLPFDTIIAALQQARGTTPERLYAFIYWHSWQLLDDPARQLLLSLLAMDVAGETLDFIQQRSGLDYADFSTAVTQLLDTSLLEVNTVLTPLRYALHPLTATFLRSGILAHWDT